MKKSLISIIIIIIVLVMAAWYWKSPDVSDELTPATNGDQQAAAVDTTTSINSDLQAIDTGSVDNAFNSVSTDINSL